MALKSPRFLKWVLLAVVMAAVVPTGFRMARRFIYPLRYSDSIREASREFGVDPFVIAAVIKVESNYQVRAISRRGAVGLMQLLPATAMQAAQRVGLKEYSTDLLFDPKVNIRLGTWYLSYLLKEFDGELPLALAAYNGGIKNVRDWKRQGLVRPGGNTEGIPFKETRDFVERVGVALENYRDLYPDELTVSGTFGQ